MNEVIELAKKFGKVKYSIMRPNFTGHQMMLADGYDFTNDELKLLIEAAKAQGAKEFRESLGEPVAWHKGWPSKPWCDEWFIARTIHRDKVVLISLPENYSYDFRTADGTYLKKENITKWMQFPESEFIAPNTKDEVK